MTASTNVNNRTVVHKSSSGIATNFPDVCKTPTPGGPVPVPYPNIAQSSDTASGSASVKIDGNPIMLKDSNFKTSTGDEPGSIGGVVSGCTKGVAEFVNYSFDVKVDGKNVPRLGDMMIQNKKNTPPMPEVQPPVIVAETEKKEKCKFCKKDEHDFAEKPGTSIGSGRKLRGNIIAIINNHCWYTGSHSLQAHHLICSESMDDDDWFEFCRLFGYDINNKNNGVMLPNTLQLACQLHVALHRGNHSGGKAASISYPAKIKNDLNEIKSDIKAGEYCSHPQALIDDLNEYSEFVLGEIEAFSWTITSDGLDYKSGRNGCAGVDSISNKPDQPCPHDRLHGLTKHNSAILIPGKTQALKIGE